MIDNTEQIAVFIQLSVAIVNSGIKENDQVFLKSEWYKELVSYIIDYNKEHRVPYVQYVKKIYTGQEERK